MGPPQRHSKSGFTYADYLTWPDGERWELIDGEAYAMSPAPTNTHQLIVGELFTTIHNYFRGKSCRPFMAPSGNCANNRLGSESAPSRMSGSSSET